MLAQSRNLNVSVGVQEMSLSDEQRLQADLFKNYVASVRPVINGSDTVLVSLSVSLMQLIGVVRNQNIYDLCSLLTLAFWSS